MKERGRENWEKTVMMMLRLMKKVYRHTRIGLYFCNKDFIYSDYLYASSVSTHTGPTDPFTQEQIENETCLRALEFCLRSAFELTVTVAGF